MLSRLQQHSTHELWLVIDARSGRAVEVRSKSRGGARVEGARRLTELSHGTDLDVLAREVIAMPARAQVA